jgi:hypothetical protein
MNLVFAISAHTGDRLAEIAYLLMLIGGIWLAAGQTSWFGLRGPRTFVAGLCFAGAGVLLIIAAHWAHYG